VNKKIVVFLFLIDTMNIEPRSNDFIWQRLKFIKNYIIQNRSK
jgi:hypothetical protein